MMSVNVGTGAAWALSRQQWEQQRLAMLLEMGRAALSELKNLLLSTPITDELALQALGVRIRLAGISVLLDDLAEDAEGGEATIAAFLVPIVTGWEITDDVGVENVGTFIARMLPLPSPTIPLPDDLGMKEWEQLLVLLTWEGRQDVIPSDDPTDEVNKAVAALRIARPNIAADTWIDWVNLTRRRLDQLDMRLK